MKRYIFVVNYSSYALFVKLSNPYISKYKNFIIWTFLDFQNKSKEGLNHDTYERKKKRLVVW